MTELYIDTMVRAVKLRVAAGEEVQSILDGWVNLTEVDKLLIIQKLEEK